jgi:hypothetical protein
MKSKFVAEPRKTTQEDFNTVSVAVIEFIKGKSQPVYIQELTDYFAGKELPIDAGRVTLQLIADRKLYLTEDRKVAVSEQCANLAQRGPTVEQILELAQSTELCYHMGYDGYASPFLEDTNISSNIIDFATKLLSEYGNTK